jgi:hypothetical protein
MAATKTATTSTTSTTEIPELAAQAREQLLATVVQGQALAVEAAQSWVKAVSALPLPELPAVPGLPVTTVEAATTYAFGVASDLLTAQRDFTLELSKVLAPVTSA